MLALALIWLTAIVMVVGAVVWVLGLIAMRLVRDVRDRALAVDQKAVTQALLAMLAEDPGAADRLQPYLRRAQLMAESIMGFQSLIRGADQERVLARLCALGLPRVLQERLVRGSQAGRLVCLEALAALDDEDARAALWAATRQGDSQVRHLAFQALVNGGVPVALDLVLAETARGRARPSRLLTEVIRQVVVADTAQAVARLAHLGLAPADRALIVEALGWAGDYALITTIAAHAEHEDAEVRAAAIRGLGQMQHPMAEPALAKALGDPAWPVRAAAAEASGLTSLGALCEPLAGLLSDPEWWVRFRAGDALARLGAKGVQRLREIALGGDALAQQTAELVLAERNL